MYITYNSSNYHVPMIKINKIIFEGPDCSGKSTAVNLIKNVLKWDSKSLHHREGDQFARYLTEYAQNSQIIFDRSHFSEAVYSELWRGGTPFSHEELTTLNFLAQRNSLIIFVCPDLAIMQQRYLNRNYAQQISLSELQKSRDLFQNIMKNVNPLIYRASSYEELDHLLAKIKEMVEDK